MSGFLNMEGPDFAAFVVAVACGYVVGLVVPNAQAAVYVSIIVSYHLFLGWLLLSAHGKAALSMSVPMTLATHVACMVVALGPAVVGNH